MKPIKRFVLRDEGVLKNAIAFLSSMNLGGKTLEVVIQPYKRNRSGEQHRYYWKIVTVIANDLGHSKDEQHEQFKLFYLLPILVRDDPDVTALYERVGTEKDRLAKLLSTTDLSVGQMTEYLEDVIHFAGQLGIMVPHPEDEYRERQEARYG